MAQKEKKKKRKKKKKKKGLVSLAGRVGFIAVHAPINCIGGANQGDTGTGDYCTSLYNTRI